ncbi:putative addiction module antidote protein [Candidatus Babeliales bacterium]|nr:putative addiction module antidote protein [Candidatus Babeliales bacterium]
MKKITKKSRHIDYHERLIEDLKDPIEAIAYLNAALMDEDPRIFLIAVRNVIEAHGLSIADIAEETNLNRENLYRTLSAKGNPKLTSIIPILNSLGLNLAIQPYKK